MDNVGLANIYKPSDLKGNFQTLRFAANSQNWPSLGNLQGKFIFVLTGDNEDLDSYLSELGNNGLAFVAAKVKKGNGSNGTAYFGAQEPNGISPNNRQHIVFFNLGDDQLNVSYNPNTGENFMEKHGYISRVYELFNTDVNEYGNDIYHKINNIAIKNVEDNFPNTLMNSQLIGINKITVGNTTSTSFIDSQYDHITQFALQTVTTQNLKILSGTHYNLRAGQEVKLLPGTEIKSGANTNISIGNCTDYVNNMRIAPNSGEEENGRALTAQEIEWMLNSAKTITNSAPIEINEAPLVYPNPAKEVVYIDYSKNSGNQAIFTLYDITGRVVQIKKYNPQNEGVQAFSVNVKELTEGTYFYTLQVGEQNYKGKIVKMGF